MPASRKRVRATAPPVPPAPLNAAALRAAIASRSGAEALPAAWRAVAAAAGISGADAFLCRLGRSIVDALRVVPTAAETARAELRSVRAALHSSVDSRCDELEEMINDAEIMKTAALERELCAVDVALERWRAERGAVAEAAASLDDYCLANRRAELMARLDDAEAQLLILPTSIVEPPHVGLVTAAPVLLAGIASFGRVVSPRAITATDLSVENIPRYAQSGRKLHLNLVLRSVQHTSQSAEELESSLGCAAASTHLVASLDTEGAERLPLQSAISAEISKRHVVVAVDVPASALAGSVVRLGTVTVAGQPVAVMVQNVGLPVRRAIGAPLRLEWSAGRDAPRSLCISAAGHLFVPLAESPKVLAFDANGARLASFPVARSGLSTSTCWAAFADGPPPSLLLADSNGATSKVVAVDPDTRVVRWATAPRIMQECGGIVALPGDGVCITASVGDGYLFAHRLSDGKRVGSIFVRGLQCRLSADPASGAVFGGVMTDGAHEISRFSVMAGSIFRNDGIVASAGFSGRRRVFTVVPPVLGTSTSHLVIANEDTSELYVFSLPDQSPVHTHELEGMKVWALAADPCGEALAVSDAASGSIHILPWPLPGTPALGAAGNNGSE